MRLGWPLVGRGRETRLVEAALSSPDTAGVVISGHAGVGKSRIAAAALDEAATRGKDVRWIAGSSAARGVPLGAMASWADPADTHALQSVCGVIERLTAATQPVVVGVDDAHQLDDMSIFVLHQIVQRRTGKLVVTLRSGETVPGGLAELWKLGDFEWLELGPLSREDTGALLAVSLGRSVDPDSVSRLHQLTGGNVLYLRHIVEHEVAQGRLAQRHDHWRWNGEPSVPPTLVELIESRIGSLRPEVATVIEVLSVGEPLELAALQRITDPEVVEEADVLGLISLDQTGPRTEVRVAHPLYGEVRRNRAAPTRLRRLRGLVAAELAAGADRDDVRVLVRRAALTVESDLDIDADLLCRAAQGAVCLADLPLAERLAEAAMYAGATSEAQFIRAHALSWLGRGEVAEEVLTEVDTTALSEDDFARYTFFRASNMLWALAQPARAQEIIAAAAHLTSARARRNVDAVRAVHAFATDRPGEALAAARDLTLQDLPPVVGGEVAWVLANIYGDAGRTAEAEAVAAAGYAIVRSSDAPQLQCNIADAHVGALLLAGQVRSAEAVADRERRQAADLPGAAQLLGTAIAGRAALGAGRLADARSMLGRAATLLSASGHDTGWAYRYRIPYVTALAASGEIAEAAALLELLQSQHRPFRSLSKETATARAWVAAGQGAVSEAIDILLRAAQSAAADELFAAEVECRQLATQFGDRSCGPRLSELTTIVEGPRVRVAARFAAALEAADAGELAAVSDAFEELGDRIAAVDAAAHATVVYRRAGLRGSALGCATRAEALATEGGGVRTPALLAAGSDLPVTDREREVIALLGLGLSNRDIAERLVLSVRTVEGHIYKAMTKTGVNSREELASLLKPRRRDGA
ncbi:LuxR C-terminal-related transcriptional regulator [Mycobacterium sp. SMC-8]|uniref:LuxR C-terminal-related transcriptional regulator n=1 Tax=Mycobacterium sp. SMC-8 TaxID=2857060 RepID=UPI0021B38508|nr:LuxR C-terminal-related transcriptional regulator [Mycobacterium sp. SMC-8]UXA10409.1 LuxR C-terminal-related transcriptional regulator [Mycobacterium sp. SMC-8]